MVVITVSKEKFDQLFESTLEKLQLARFAPGGALTMEEAARFENSPIGQMHAQFRFDIVKLKRRLEEA